jgi:hypothetical protein
MRRFFLGGSLVGLGLVYAWLGSRVADPAGAPLLTLPSDAHESARWIATQLWGISIAAFVAAGAAILLGRLGPVARSAIVAFGAASALLLAHSFNQALWTELAALAGVAASLTFFWGQPLALRERARRTAG